MSRFTVTAANAFLDALAASQDFARDAGALRTLFNDGLAADEIASLTRGTFQTELIQALADAREAAQATEPVSTVTKRE